MASVAARAAARSRRIFGRWAAPILDGDRDDDRLSYRAVTVELIGLLGILARAKIIKTATTPIV